MEEFSNDLADEPMKETFFGLTKAKFTGLMVVLLVFTLNATLFLVWQRISDISAIQEGNRRAIAHLCVTQTAVEVVLDQATTLAEKIGLDNLTPEQLRLYRVEKAQLASVRQDAACDDVVR